MGDVCKCKEYLQDYLVNENQFIELLKIKL